MQEAWVRFLVRELDPQPRLRVLQLKTPQDTITGSLFKLTSIVLLMPSNHLILCLPLLLLPSVFLSIRVFSNRSKPNGDLLTFRASFHVKEALQRKNESPFKAN